MSTKSSLACGETFHLYHEAGEGALAVYLQVRGPTVEFRVAPKSVTVRIPIDVWEHIRHQGGFVPKYHLMDDEALLAHVTRAVDERIRAWTDSDGRGLRALFGAAIYGLASDPREEQIAQGFECLSQRRAEERDIIKRIEALKEADK